MSVFPQNNFDLDNPSLISVLDELPFWSAPFGIKLLEKIIPGKNKTVLDIGCGTGFPLVELAMRFGDSCRIFGLDPWKAALVRAQEKIIAFGVTNVELINSVAEDMPLPDHSLDLITSNNGLNNVSDLERSLSECARVLKPGGQLVFTMNLEGTMTEFYSVMESILERYHLGDAILKMRQHIYEKRKPLEEVLEMLQKHGFMLGSVDRDEFSYSFTDGSTMFRHFFIRIAFMEAWEKIVPAEQHLKIFAEIEDVINKLSNDKGFYRVTVPFIVISSLKG